jgi:hypothetical protein
MNLPVYFLRFECSQRDSQLPSKDSKKCGSAPNAVPAVHKTINDIKSLFILLCG